MERIPALPSFSAVSRQTCQRLGDEFAKKEPGDIVESTTHYVPTFDFLKDNSFLNFYGLQDNEKKEFAKIFLKELIGFVFDTNKEEVTLLNRSDFECALIKSNETNKILFVERCYTTEGSYFSGYCKVAEEQKIFCEIDINELQDTVNYAIHQFENRNTNNLVPRLSHNNNRVIKELTAPYFIQQNSHSTELSIKSDWRAQWNAHHNAMVSVHSGEISFPIRELPDSKTIFSSRSLGAFDPSQQLRQLEDYVDKGTLPIYEEDKSNLLVNFFHLTMTAKPGNGRKYWEFYSPTTTEFKKFQWPEHHLAYYLHILNDIKCLTLKTGYGADIYVSLATGVTKCFFSLCDFLKNHYQGEDLILSNENELTCPQLYIETRTQYKVAFFNLLQHNPNLTHISILNCFDFGNHILELIRNNSTITQLCLDKIHFEDPQELNNAMRENTTLKQIELKRCDAIDSRTVLDLYLERNRQLPLLPSKAVQFLSGVEQYNIPEELIYMILDLLHASILSVDETPKHVAPKDDV